MLDVVGAKPEDARTAGFQPYIAPETQIREFTILPLVLGVVLGIVFGASSLYLVLKVGLTVSASIPVAVIAITFFHLIAKFGARNATILENNIVQTAGSAGESIAFGVGVTMPSILILGFDLEVTRVMVVACLGGLLGILLMIPLRRALIVAQHGVLKYPEGTACAEVLKAGASDESRAAASDAVKAQWSTAELAGTSNAARTGARTVFSGFGLGFVYMTLMAALKAWKDTPGMVFGKPLAGGSVAAEISPALLGVGYIIGPRIASVMLAGGALAYLVLIPAIKFFGGSATEALPPGTIPIADMSPNQVRGAYLLYIGAGAVAAGGIISLVRSLPIILHSLRSGLADLGKAGAGAEGRPRTDRDLSMKFVGIGILVLLALIMATPSLHMNVLGAMLIVVFGFLFVTVSSRLTGEIGSSSNPISGMTVATLLLTCLIFLILGWTGPSYYVTALSVGGIVCIAASNGGTTSQDLKTGYLVGATPRYQQIAILIGAFASALLLGPILLALNSASTVYVPPTMTVKEKVVTTFSPTLTAPPEALEGPTEKLQGPQAASDQGAYHSWHKLSDDKDGPAGKYLVNDQGVATYLVDPGINGVHDTRPDGSTVKKYDAPKATLMSYIIKGILNQELPWGLVILGVMIAVVLELAGIPSLAFAVGVYLPISSSVPIFLGGALRYFLDKRLGKHLKHREMTEQQLSAETDRSSGVLLASGYIAGGAIAGIVIAFLAGLEDGAYDKAITEWSAAHNPFFEGPWADPLSLIPFAVLCAILWWVGRKGIDQIAKVHGG
ncbi:MAG: oligopeptide transporter, OPT family [Candidatus Sericytochromatia bacterium]|nr:oligopeptide transporter, OPT family [Candidatus Tanganyikabacteria bacterium]